MSDELKATSDKLRTAAGIWEGAATDIKKVHTDLQPAVDQGDKFGALAGSSGVSGNYDIWVKAMSEAAATGEKNFKWLDAALTAIADTYDGTDSTVAQSVEALDRMI
ncbi:MAG TPA: hypothetical protein VNQ53_15585 [Nocardioides sp.]|nr:hypothetical protein [Nocardioides sp.]